MNGAAVVCGRCILPSDVGMRKKVRQHGWLACGMLEVVIASLAGDKCWLLFGGMAMARFLWMMGLVFRAGRNPMRLRTTATSAGVVTFLKASFLPFPLCPFLSNEGNLRSSLLVLAVVAPRRHYLVGGTVMVALGVPRRLAKSGGCYPERGPLRAQCTLMRLLFGNALLRFGQVLPSTRHYFFLASWVGRTLACASLGFALCFRVVLLRL
jgi:hypothetical protein